MLPTAFRRWARKPRNPPLFALDSESPIRINPWESFLKGWIVPPSSDHFDVGIIADGIFVRSVYGLSRPDVAAHLKDPAAENTGFYVRFQNPVRNHRIKLIAEGESGRTVLAELAIPAADPMAPIETYQDWLIHREPGLFWPADEVTTRLSALPYQPLISVILPTTHSDRSVQSVHRQQYTQWQLCDSGDRSSARGDFVVLLGEDDELHPSALLEVVKRLNEQDGCVLLYSDEDWMDSNGSRSKPVFKPDFDPDMLEAFNYTGNLLAKKRNADQRARPGAVQHLAKPLYHRRIGAEGFASPVRVKYSAPRAATVVVFIRAEDGDFQVQTLRALPDYGRQVMIYQGLDSDAAADIFVFINRPLETLNHTFIEELAAQALREECGLVTGISVTGEGQVLHSGFVRAAADDLIDPLVGIKLWAAIELGVPRAVETISDEFFAVRREHLKATGGLDQMPQLVHKLVMNARLHGMRVLVTPFAVATFQGGSQIDVEPVPPHQSSVWLNPNLLACKGPFCAAFK